MIGQGFNEISSPGKTNYRILEVHICLEIIMLIKIIIIIIIIVFAFNIIPHFISSAA